MLLGLCGACVTLSNASPQMAGFTNLTVAGHGSSTWTKAIHPPPPPGLSLEGGEKNFLTPTETNVHRDTLCFLVMGPSLLPRLAIGVRQLVVVAVGG